MVASGIAAALKLHLDVKPFELTGYIPPGIPSFSVPRFTLNVTIGGNDTEGYEELGENKIITLSDMIEVTLIYTLNVVLVFFMPVSWLCC